MDFITEILNAVGKALGTQSASSNSSSAETAASSATDSYVPSSAGIDTNSTSNAALNQVLTEDEESEGATNPSNASQISTSYDPSVQKVVDQNASLADKGDGAGYTTASMQDNDGFYTTGADRDKNYINAQTDLIQNTEVAKGGFIKQAQENGVSQSDAQKKIQEIDQQALKDVNKPNTTQQNGAWVDPNSTTNPYQKEYQNHGGDNNHSKDQKLLKKEATLYDTAKKQDQEMYQRGQAAGKSDSGIKKDIQDQNETTNIALGMNQKQSVAEKTNQSQNSNQNGVQAFEAQYGLQSNSANNYLAQTELNRQKAQQLENTPAPKGDHALTDNVMKGSEELSKQPKAPEVAATYSKLHQQDLQNGTAGGKDDQIGQALNNFASKLFQNQNQQNTGSTLNKYSQDNVQMQNQVQNQKTNQAQSQNSNELEK